MQTSVIDETVYNKWRISRRKMKIGTRMEMRSIKSKDGSSSYGDSRTSGRDVMMMNLDGASNSSGVYYMKKLTGRSSDKMANSAQRSNSPMSDSRGSISSFKSGGSGTEIRRLNE